MTNIHLAINETHTVQLPGRGTAGYVWSAAVDDPQVARVVSLGTAASDSTPASPSPGFSSSRDELFQIVTLATGQTAIRFTQSRPFEKNKPPLATSEFLAIVGQSA